MMPFSKEKTRGIYITALIISFLLIVGSIYLHLRQKTHLGRMSFNLDRDLVKPTSGVGTTTWIDEYESKLINKTNENIDTEDIVDEDNDFVEASSPADDEYILHRTADSDEISSTEDINYGLHYAGLRKTVPHEDIIDDQYMDNLSDDIDKIVDDGDANTKQNPEYELKSLEQNSTTCLRCLCMTVNECRPTFCGSGNPCGLYRISKMYWIDAGKPTIAGGTTDNEDQDYLTCVNEDTCSATVIQQYYNRYKRDCNRDGIFDCRDQIALHLLGPSGCLTENLSHIHTNRMKNCLIESSLNYYQYSSEEDYEQYV